VTGQFRLHKPAAYAFVVDVISKQLFADARPAFLVLDVLLVFLSEIQYCAEHGIGSRLASPQSRRLLIILPNRSRLSMSYISPLPSVILMRISSIRLVPSLHGVHLPQDSFCVNSRKNSRYRPYRNPGQRQSCRRNP